MRKSSFFLIFTSFCLLIALILIGTIGSDEVQPESLVAGNYQINEVSAELPGTAKFTVYLDGAIELTKDSFSMNVMLAGNFMNDPIFTQRHTVSGLYSLNKYTITFSNLKMDGRTELGSKDDIYTGSVHFVGKNIYVDVMLFKDAEGIMESRERFLKNVKVTLMLTK